MSTSTDHHDTRSLLAIEQKLTNALNLAKSLKDENIQQELESAQHLLRNETARIATEILRQSKVLTFETDEDDEYILKSQVGRDVLPNIRRANSTNDAISETRENRRMEAKNEVQILNVQNTQNKKLLESIQMPSSKSISESTKAKLFTSHHPQQATNLPIKESRRDELDRGILTLIERKLIPPTANLVIKPPPFNQTKMNLKERLSVVLPGHGEEVVENDDDELVNKKFIRQKSQNLQNDELQLSIYKLDKGYKEILVKEGNGKGDTQKFKSQITTKQTNKMIKAPLPSKLNNTNKKQKMPIANSKLNKPSTAHETNNLKAIESSGQTVPQNSRQPSAKVYDVNLNSSKTTIINTNDLELLPHQNHPGPDTENPHKSLNKNKTEMIDHNPLFEIRFENIKKSENVKFEDFVRLVLGIPIPKVNDYTNTSITSNDDPSTSNNLSYLTTKMKHEMTAAKNIYDRLVKLVYLYSIPLAIIESSRLISLAADNLLTNHLLTDRQIVNSCTNNAIEVLTIISIPGRKGLGVVINLFFYFSHFFYCIRC